MVKDPVLCTFTGRVVNPLNLRPHDIDIVDIAHHLALINRFVGGTKRPISVAQHSVYVMRIVKNTNPDLAVAALLHDASEAYLGDVSKWVKQSAAMEGYRIAEEKAEAVISGVFNFPRWAEDGVVVMHPVIKAADNLMVRFEAMKMWGYDHPLFTLKDYPQLSKEEIQTVGAWAPWTWRDSKHVFLAHARELGILDRERAVEV